MASHGMSTEPDQAPDIECVENIATDVLPPILGPVFPYEHFNAMQSQCFERIYKTDVNFVLSAPTASGKTAILELAVCRLFITHKVGEYKVVYQAPTKSLCSERQKDWEIKFAHMGLKCAELTGDTEVSQQHVVQQADIIITTPEKWDSITRRWHDHKKLMAMVRLFLIDEVHILKEDRGASLEVVVSRMKSMDRPARFIALSATIPNSSDVARWLGESNRVPLMPAAIAVFGEEFRPVPLNRHVEGIQANGANEFAFDKICSNMSAPTSSKGSFH